MTNKRKMVWNREDGEDIHSCSYYCTRPACVLAQRNEFRDKQYQCTITTATLACKKPVKQAEPVDAVLAEREACLNQIEIIVEAEREACAKVCDGWPDYDVQGLAEAIRARGKQ